jgi:hypothetical protein
MRSNVNGSGSGSLQLLPALGSFALSKYRIALTFVTLYILNTPSADENIALVLSFNVSAPIIGVNPSRGSTDAPVGLNLVEIEEVAPNGTVVRTASALKGNTRTTSHDTTAHARMTHDTTRHTRLRM